MFLPQNERPCLVPIQYNWQNHSFVYFNHHRRRRRRRLSRIRPLDLFRFRIYFLKLMSLFRHLVGLLGWGSARHKLSIYTGQHNTEKRGHTSCLEWDSNKQSQCSSGRRQYVPQTTRPLGPAVYFNN
jgi:hypothetical protein